MTTLDDLKQIVKTLEDLEVPVKGYFFVVVYGNKDRNEVLRAGFIDRNIIQLNDIGIMHIALSRALRDLEDMWDELDSQVEYKEG